LRLTRASGLCGRIDLIAAAAHGKGGEPSETAGDPGASLGATQETVLDRRGFCVQGPDLVALQPAGFGPNRAFLFAPALEGMPQKAAQGAPGALRHFR